MEPLGNVRYNTDPILKNLTVQQEDEAAVGTGSLKSVFFSQFFQQGCEHDQEIIFPIGLISKPKDTSVSHKNKVLETISKIPVYFFFLMISFEFYLPTVRFQIWKSMC